MTKRGDCCWEKRQCWRLSVQHSIAAIYLCLYLRLEQFWLAPSLLFTVLVAMTVDMALCGAGLVAWQRRVVFWNKVG